MFFARVAVVVVVGFLVLVVVVANKTCAHTVPTDSARSLVDTVVASFEVRA